MKDKSFLVTGGAGFIGSHIVERLLSDGAKKVRVLDNLSSGNRANIAGFETNPAFEFIEGDIRDANICAQACEGINYVFHEAALVSVPRSIKEPEEYQAVNVTGFFNVLNAARNAGVTRVVYASSSSVYGDDQTLPKIEPQIGKALSPYALTKQIDEEYSDLFARVYGFSSIGLRYFNVFGPRQNLASAYAAAIPKFIANILTDKPVTVFGDGEQTRDFTFVENIVEANIRALDAKDVFTVFNVGAGDRVTVKELIATIAELTHKEPIIEFSEVRKGDIPHSYADIEKARIEIGYVPKLKLREGLEKTIVYYKTII